MAELLKKSHFDPHLNDQFNVHTESAGLVNLELVEVAETEELFKHPLNPYTRALLSAIPYPDPQVRRERIILEGDVPSPINPPNGCRFHGRCWRVMEKCRSVEPILKNCGGDHLTSCHLI